MMRRYNREEGNTTKAIVNGIVNSDVWACQFDVVMQHCQKVLAGGRHNRERG